MTFSPEAQELIDRTKAHGHDVTALVADTDALLLEISGSAPKRSVDGGSSVTELHLVRATDDFKDSRVAQARIEGAEPSVYFLGVSSLTSSPVLPAPASGAGPSFSGGPSFNTLTGTLIVGVGFASLTLIWAVLERAQ